MFRYNTDFGLGIILHISTLFVLLYIMSGSDSSSQFHLSVLSGKSLVYQFSVAHEAGQQLHVKTW